MYTHTVWRTSRHNSNFWKWVVAFPSYTTKQLQYNDSITRTLFWKAESITWRKSLYENTRAYKRRFRHLFFNPEVRFKCVRSAQKQRWRAIFASLLQTFRDNPSVSSWTLNTEPIGCPETSVTTNTRCVTSYKIEDLVYTVAFARNHSVCMQLPLSVWHRRPAELTTVTKQPLKSIEIQCTLACYFS